MGKNKPRWYPDKPQNNFGHCPYDDGTFSKECGRPYATKCDGNMHKCYKLYLQHLATLSDKGKERLHNRYVENAKWGAPRTNLIK